MTPAEFSREIESYLCRKNDGHLIRIVGPVFEQVCGWSRQGVPLRVAFQGIDRYFERRQAKGPAAMRRPARVEFCEPDVLDAFDAWRRAVGVAPGTVTDEARAEDEGTVAEADARGAARPAGGRIDTSEQTAAAARRKTGLQTHIDRVMARLTQRRVEAGVSSGLADAIDRLLGDLDTMRASAKGARNDTRADIVTRLASLEHTLIEAARAAVDPGLWDTAMRDAREELEPFRARMDEATYEQARRAAAERTFRALVRLPSVRADA